MFRPRARRADGDLSSGTAQSSEDTAKILPCNAQAPSPVVVRVSSPSPLCGEATERQKSGDCRGPQSDICNGRGSRLPKLHNELKTTSGGGTDSSSNRANCNRQPTACSGNDVPEPSLRRLGKGRRIEWRLFPGQQLLELAASIDRREVRDHAAALGNRSRATAFRCAAKQCHGAKSRLQGRTWCQAQ